MLDNELNGDIILHVSENVELQQIEGIPREKNQIEKQQIEGKQDEQTQDQKIQIPKKTWCRTICIIVLFSGIIYVCHKYYYSVMVENLYICNAFSTISNKQVTSLTIKKSNYNTTYTCDNTNDNCSAELDVCDSWLSDSQFYNSGNDYYCACELINDKLDIYEGDCCTKCCRNCCAGGIEDASARLRSNMYQCVCNCGCNVAVFIMITCSVIIASSIIYAASFYC